VTTMPPVRDAAVAPVRDPAAPLPMTFTASGDEYFRIWIVNLLLTVLTLGVYSAWAKVRREKYFHQHTMLAGIGFDYHGSPSAILRGRLLSLGLLGLTQADFLGSIITTGAWIVFFAILPWLMQRSIGFRLANTSYRGLRLAFDGTVAEAYQIVLGFTALAAVLVTVPALILVGDAGRLVVLMVPLVAVLLYPMMHATWRRYAIDHSRFVNLKLVTRFRSREFIAIYVAVIALWFLMTLPAIVLIAAADRLTELLAERDIDTRALNQGVTLLGGLIAYCLASSIWPYITARVQNLTWGQARLGEHVIHSALDPIAYVRLQLKNLLLTIVSLGLYRPFAAVATARMRIGAVTLQPAGDFHQAIVAIPPPDDVAIGAEAMDLLGFDISL